MKAIFSSISRLFFAYSKFIVMITMLSALNTAVVNSSEATYLKCNDNCYGLTRIYLESNYNIRSKKIKITQYKISVYTKEVINMNKLGVLNY